MIRRAASILFLLLANLILLAHTVIPHHHHDSEICLYGIYHSNHTENPQDCQSENKHTPDQKGDFEKCSLQHIAIIPQTNQDFSYAYQQVNDISFNKFLSYAVSSDHQNEPMLEIILRTYSLIPYNAPSLKSNIGLRAPPLV